MVHGCFGIRIWHLEFVWNLVLEISSFTQTVYVPQFLVGRRMVAKKSPACNRYRYAPLEQMNVSKKMVADQLANYLNHKVAKEELIEWCEGLMQDATFESNVVQEIVARIGLMDAKNFEVSYEDLSDMLKRLGYQLKVEVL